MQGFNRNELINILKKNRKGDYFSLFDGYLDEEIPSSIPRANVRVRGVEIGRARASARLRITVP